MIAAHMAGCMSTKIQAPAQHSRPGPRRLSCQCHNHVDFNRRTRDRPRLRLSGNASFSLAEEGSSSSSLVSRSSQQTHSLNASMRPQIARTVRTLGRRANSSTTVEKAKAAAQNVAESPQAQKAKAAAQDVIENPQVQKAVASANQAYAQGAAAFQRVAGPVGDKVGNMLGGE